MKKIFLLLTFSFVTVFFQQASAMYVSPKELPQSSSFADTTTHGHSPDSLAQEQAEKIREIEALITTKLQALKNAECRQTKLKIHAEINELRQQIADLITPPEISLKELSLSNPQCVKASSSISASSVFTFTSKENSQEAQAVDRDPQTIQKLAVLDAKIIEKMTELSEAVKLLATEQEKTPRRQLQSVGFKVTTQCNRLALLPLENSIKELEAIIEDLVFLYELTLNGNEHLYHLD